MKNINTLTPTNWIEAAFRALTKKGPEGIRAEAIARDLKVSKGSFYWHFKDVPALKTAMLSHWKKAATETIISLIEDSGGSPEEQLELLVTIATGANNTPYGGALTEAAIRDWGRYDKVTATAVKLVDNNRLKYLVDLFERSGIKPALSKSNAAILYGALIGLENLSQNKLSDPPKQLQTLLLMLLNSK